MQIRERTEALWELESKAYEEGHEEIARLARQLKTTLERLEDQLDWMEKTIRKLQEESPSSFNSLGEFQSNAVMADVAVGQAAVLAELLEKAARNSSKEIQALVGKVLGWAR